MEILIFKAMGRLTINTCFSFLVVIIAISSCQQESEDPVKTINPIEIENLQLFLDFEQHGLQVPRQIESLPSGEIAVLDNSSNKVLIIGPDGELINRFGGTGRGPGEFIRPAMQKSDNYMYVVDSDLLRINQFSLSGEFVQSYNIDSRQGVTVKDEETYFYRAMGEEGSLIKKINKQENSTHFIGEAMGEEEQYRDLDREKNVLRRGEIPNSFKNTITMYYSDPHLYVFLDAYSRLQKYNKDGDLVWDQSIELPENELIFNEVVERAKEPGPPGAVPVFRYITSIKVIEGQTYLLWFPVNNHPRKLVKVDSNGNLDSIYHIPEEVPTFSDFSIDTENNFLYLIAPELGQIHRTNYPG